MTRAQTASASSKISNVRKNVVQKSLPSSTSRPVLRNQTDKIVTSKQEAGPGYDPKLVEMINTAIVDRSPSVKWEDVGEDL